MMEEYGYTLDDVSSKKYEIKYLGNQKFSEPTVLEETTFSDQLKNCE